VARGTQHRKRRPAQNAGSRSVATAPAAPRKQKPPEWQEQLFFQRLRVHAKWAFVVLAVVFAGGFVVFGVGSGSTGVSDALSNFFSGNGGGGTSISSLQHKVQRDPADANGWRDLATAYETKQRTADAVSALERYTTLAPKDQDALLDLAGQYQKQAQDYATDYQNAQAQQAAAQVPLSAFPPPANSPFGKALQDPNALKDPIAAAVQTRVNEQQNTALTGYQTAVANAESTYEKLAKLSPNDPSTQVLLAQAAETANDTTTAIAAYKRFLKLAPNDTSAATIRQQLKSLEKAAAGSTTTTTK
jgi:tetratricopeptide (TPR) repeat protein